MRRYSASMKGFRLEVEVDSRERENIWLQIKFNMFGKIDMLQQEPNWLTLSVMTDLPYWLASPSEFLDVNFVQTSWSVRLYCLDCWS